MDKDFTAFGPWQKAIALAIEIHRITKIFPPDERYAVTSQLRRAALSVGANIAEGFGRFTYPDKAHKYIQARGELVEVMSFLYYCHAVGYLPDDEKEKCFNNCREIQKLLNALITKLNGTKPFSLPFVLRPQSFKHPLMNNQPLPQSNELYKGHGWRIVKEEAPLPDGRIKRKARAHRCDIAHILAFTKDGNVVLIREFRPFLKDYIWMLPGGKVDKESNPIEAAQRELREEAGYSAARIEPYCVGRHSEVLQQLDHIFLAFDLTHDPLPQDDYEMIEVHEMPISEAINRVLSCPIIHSVSAFALLRYAREHHL